MSITYQPPKGQIWGHRVGRLSPSQLADRAERFLREKATIVDAPPPGLTVAWEPYRSPGITAAVEASPLFAGAEGEDRETPLLGAGTLRRVSRMLAPASFPDAVRWLEALDSELDDRGGLPQVQLDRHLWIRWRDPSGREDAAPGVPDSWVGFHFGRPRRVTTAFHFASVEHYLQSKQYLQRIGLVTLSDKHVRPKGAAGGGVRDPA